MQDHRARSTLSPAQQSEHAFQETITEYIFSPHLSSILCSPSLPVTQLLITLHAPFRKRGHAWILPYYHYQVHKCCFIWSWLYFPPSPHSNPPASLCPMLFPEQTMHIPSSGPLPLLPSPTHLPPSLLHTLQSRSKDPYSEVLQGHPVQNRPPLSFYPITLLYLPIFLLPGHTP